MTLTSVLGPVLLPPCNLQRPPRPLPGAWHGLPFRVFALHLRFAPPTTGHFLNFHDARAQPGAVAAPKGGVGPMVWHC